MSIPASDYYISTLYTHSHTYTHLSSLTPIWEEAPSPSLRLSHVQGRSRTSFTRGRMRSRGVHFSGEKESISLSHVCEEERGGGGGREGPSPSRVEAEAELSLSLSLICRRRNICPSQKRRKPASPSRVGSRAALSHEKKTNLSLQLGKRLETISLRGTGGVPALSLSLSLSDEKMPHYLARARE